MPDEEVIDTNTYVQKAENVLSNPIDLGNGVLAGKAVANYVYLMENGIRIYYLGGFSVFVSYSDPEVVEVLRTIEQKGFSQLEGG